MTLELIFLALKRKRSDLYLIISTPTTCLLSQKVIASLRFCAKGFAFAIQRSRILKLKEVLEEQGKFLNLDLNSSRTKTLNTISFFYSLSCFISIPIAYDFTN